MANRPPSLTVAERSQLSQWLDGDSMATAVPQPIYKATVDGWNVSWRAGEAEGEGGDGARRENRKRRRLARKITRRIPQRQETTMGRAE